MMKAFLSHSWTEKEFVRAVANELGRQYSLFDEQSFDTAETFKRSIEKHLDGTCIFVLFATKEALKRVWVNFEIQEAWYRKLEGKITESMVFLLDTSLNPTDHPPWLARAKITRVNVPKLVAREIRQHLDEQIRSEQRPYFEGRGADMERFEGIMTPIGSPPPRVAAIHGLPNIGKRTFLAKAAAPTLTLNRILAIEVSDGDGLVEIAIKFADKIEPYSSRLGFEHIVDKIKSENETKLRARIVANFVTAVQNKELPVLVDDGGVYTPEGFFVECIKSIISEVHSSDNLYLVLVSNRKPADHIASLSLRPLTQDHIKRLISKLSFDEKISLSVQQISELSEYVNGYPPSAFYAIELVKAYGIEAVLGEKHRLVKFRVSVFVKYLTDRALSDQQKNILAVLARYSPLPISVLVDVLGFDVASLSVELMSLADHALVTPNETGMYAIADPLVDAISAAFKSQSDIDHTNVANALKRVLENEEAELPRLDLYRLMYRAAVRSGENTDSLFHMTNDLIRLAEDFYHRKDYKSSVKYAAAALAELEKNEKTHDLLIRGYIQDEAWDSAETEIVLYSKYAPQRDIFFLKGFLDRKRGKLGSAIVAFKEAERLGRRGMTLKRELATCYYHNGQLADAKQYIMQAMAIEENRFIVDLSIQISTQEGDEATARSGLLKLQSLDTERFVKHRLSAIELRFGTVEDALAAARAAVAAAGDNRPPFGILAQLVTSLTRHGDFTEAMAVIQNLSGHYGGRKSDIRIGLECRLEIAQGRYARALQLFDQIKDDKPIVYKVMKRDALAGELSAGGLKDETRIAYLKQLDILNADLAFEDVAGVWLALVR
jgi:tetratricopeptide (TPR) repeat protein